MAESSDSEWDEEVILDSGVADLQQSPGIPPPPPTPPEQVEHVQPVPVVVVANNNTNRGRVLMPWRKDPALIVCLLKLAITEGYHLPLKSKKNILLAE